LGSWLAAA